MENKDEFTELVVFDGVDYYVAKECNDEIGEELICKCDDIEKASEIANTLNRRYDQEEVDDQER